MDAIVVGGGLAGCEAAYQLAKRGVFVTLIEMKPQRRSPAHHSNNMCELVCSNSLRGERLETGAGLLKEELRFLDSIIIKAANETKVAAGGALAVDRVGFSELVTKMIIEHPNITVVHRELKEIPEGNVIIATGPLTDGEMAKAITTLTGDDGLYFFDAAAPIVELDSIDMNQAFYAARYDRGTPDYINCPMTKEEYTIFYEALISAETAQLKEFDKDALKVFEGCMPIEVMAKRGFETPLFGPLKPVGLIDPKTGKMPFSCVQLRQDNKEGSLYNIVGFQTHLTFSEQKRVFSLIPALKNADFARFGVMHRNTFINSTKFLDSSYMFKTKPGLYFAGQMTGVEGYIESASSGLVAGIGLFRHMTGLKQVSFPLDTAIGALAGYISNNSVENFQPMNINFGILPSLDRRIKNKQERYHETALRALDSLKNFILNNNI